VHRARGVVGLIALRLPSVPGRVKLILLPVRSD
jgi:hypothetical protein